MSIVGLFDESRPAEFEGDYQGEVIRQMEEAVRSPSADRGVPDPNVRSPSADRGVPGPDFRR